jgi:hypothetical protein
MTLITVPDCLQDYMESADMRLERTDFQMRSAFTRQRQVLSYPSGHLWVFSFGLPNMPEPYAGDTRAFLVDMDGRANTCQMRVPGYSTPSNGYSGAIGLVKGADQTGYSLETDGWPTSQTILPKGAYITVNDELKVLTAPLISDGAGEATASFKPAIRNSPADNSQIIFNNPYAVMSLADPNAAAWSLKAPRFHGFSLAFEEAVDI